MNLYDLSVDLDLRLQSMRQEDSTQDLVAKAENMVEVLEEVASGLNSVLSFRSLNAIENYPSIDRKAATGAIRIFRAGVSSYGPKAFQQQPAAKLIELAKDYRLRSSRWASAQWKLMFTTFQPLLDRAQPGGLSGSSIHRRNAERIALKLTMLQRQDPTSDRTKILTDLCNGDSSVRWRDKLEDLANELGRELDALQLEQEALTPDVQSVLRAASSEDGLSLESLTVDTLHNLKAAGVASDLVVRRR